MRVVAVEPDPVAICKLLENIRAAAFEDRIEVVNAAIWGEPLLKLFSASLGDSETSLWDARLRGGRTIIAGSSYFTASARLSDLIRRTGENADSIVKIDIEGAEYLLVDDLSESLTNSRATMILSMHPENVVRHSNVKDVDRIQNMSVTLFQNLPKYSCFCWKTDHWALGNQDDLLRIAGQEGELLRVVIGTDRSVELDILSFNAQAPRAVRPK